MCVSEHLLHRLAMWHLLTQYRRRKSAHKLAMAKDHKAFPVSLSIAGRTACAIETCSHQCHQPLCRRFRATLGGLDFDCIFSLHPYYSRDYRSTIHIKLRLRRTGVFPEVQIYGFKCFSGPTRVFKFMKNHDVSSHVGQKNRPWTKPFDRSVLGLYFMKIDDILTKCILETYST